MEQKQENVVQLHNSEVLEQPAISYYSFCWEYYEPDDLYFCDLKVKKDGTDYDVSAVGDRDEEVIEVVIKLQTQPLLAYVLPTENFQKGTYLLALKHAFILL